MVGSLLWWLEPRYLDLPQWVLPWGLIGLWLVSLGGGLLLSRKTISPSPTLVEVLGKSSTLLCSVDKQGTVHFIHYNRHHTQDLEDCLDTLPELSTDIERAHRESAITSFYSIGNKSYRVHFQWSVDCEDHIDVVFVDVTREQGQSSQIELFDNIFHSTSDAIIIADKRRKVCRVNHQFSVITGFSSKEVFGMRLNFPISPQNKMSFYRDVLKNLNTEGYWCGDIWGKRKNGEMFSGRMKVALSRTTEGDVGHYIAFFSDVTELKRSEEELRYLANHDTLTNLPNRRLFFDRIDQAIKRARRADGQFAIYFVDLDGFKGINDELGHPVGDELLKAVANRLLSVVRDSDTVARLAGDEFTIVAEQIEGLEEAKNIAEKIIKCFDPAFMLGEHQVYIAASVGVGLYPGDGEDMMELIKGADAAMYRAKADKGRGSYFMLSSHNGIQFKPDAFFVAELRNALSREQLQLVYQPQVSLSSGEIVGCEALLRWQHQQLGQIQPHQFLPVAKSEGVFPEMEMWVLQQVCEQMAKWMEQKLPVKFITLNVTGSQINNSLFVPKVKETLLKTGLSPEHLVVEISEESILDDLEKGEQFIQALRAIGVDTILDDFGISRHEFSYLKSLPVSGIKIDNQHLQHLKRGQQGDLLFRAMLGLGDILDIKVIAEGVERGMQEHYLQDVGCRYAQGFLYGKPMSADSFQKLFYHAAEVDSDVDSAAGIA